MIQHERPMLLNSLTEKHTPITPADERAQWENFSGRHKRAIPELAKFMMYPRRLSGNRLTSADERRLKAITQEPRPYRSAGTAFLSPARNLPGTDFLEKMELESYRESLKRSRSDGYFSNSTMLEGAAARKSK